MKVKLIFKWQQSRKKSKAYATRRGNYLVFHGSQRNFIKNGAAILEDSISLFHGRSNPLRHFSIDELNNMKVQSDRISDIVFLHQGSWEGKNVLIKLYPSSRRHQQNIRLRDQLLRDIVVATQMATHNNVHKLLGCCLEIQYPVLVYEWLEVQTLQERILLIEANKYKLQVLLWNDRLRIAWEISNVVAYIHSAFPQPIIYKDLKPNNIFLGPAGTAKLCDFSLCVSIPEDEEFVEENHIEGTPGFIAPEYLMYAKVAESADVYSFGVLLLMLLTGKNPIENVLVYVRKGIKDKCINNIVDPAIIGNGVTDIEELQLKASIQIALLCVADEAHSRPTMEEVATELMNVIRFPKSVFTTGKLQGMGIYRIFNGSKEFLLQNKSLLLEESRSLFQDEVDCIRYFSIDELNNIKVEHDPIFQCGFCNWYQAFWERRPVLVILQYTSYDQAQLIFIREIVVANQMRNHNNIHKLLGCCLETKFPVLVYECVATQTLKDRIILKDEQQLPPLYWKDRLKIAKEISKVVSYLHTSFPRPIIIHGSLKAHNVLLDKDNTAKLSNFGYVSLRTSENLAIASIEGREVEESTDVYSFGVLFLMLLTGKDAIILSGSSEAGNAKSTNVVDWVTRKLRQETASEIVDSAISNNGEATFELLNASIELALRCTATLEDCRPTMLDVASELENMFSRSLENIPHTRSFQKGGIYRIFFGSRENFIQNEALVQKESTLMFPGGSNPICYFSVIELNSMNVEYDRTIWNRDCDWCQGSWEGRAVLIKLPAKTLIEGGLTSSKDYRLRLFREIVVVSQMISHNNVHKLLGCCLETKCPVLVYEWVAPHTLEDRILLKDKNQNSISILEWKDRLRIAQEISQVVSDLHTVCLRPIIHGYLEPDNVFLNQDNVAKLTNFCRAVAIPEGEVFVLDSSGALGYYMEPEYLTPEYNKTRRVEKSTDVYSFGMLFLVLLTGKLAFFNYTTAKKNVEWTRLIDWVKEETQKKHISEIVDPITTKNGVSIAEARACMKLALRCTSTKNDRRPTMVEVARELSNIIRSSDFACCGSLLPGCINV